MRVLLPEHVAFCIHVSTVTTKSKANKKKIKITINYVNPCVKTHSIATMTYHDTGFSLYDT